MLVAVVEVVGDPVDEIELRHRVEAVGDSRWDVQHPRLPVGEVDRERSGALDRLSQIHEANLSGAADHVPRVRLVRVVVEAPQHVLPRMRMVALDERDTERFLSHQLHEPPAAVVVPDEVGELHTRDLEVLDLHRVS